MLKAKREEILVKAQQKAEKEATERNEAKRQNEKLALKKAMDVSFHTLSMFVLAATVTL